MDETEHPDLSPEVRALKARVEALEGGRQVEQQMLRNAAVVIGQAQARVEVLAEALRGLVQIYNSGSGRDDRTVLGWGGRWHGAWDRACAALAAADSE